MTGWGLATPAMLMGVLLYLMPIACLVVLSARNYELGAIDVQWVGWEKFINALNDPVFLRSLRNTLLYIAIVIPSSVLLGLAAALLVHGRKRSRGYY